MNSGTKIRLLLFILTLSFIGTALTISMFITSDEILNMETKELNEYIVQKEKAIEKVFADSITMRTFKNFDQYPLQTYDALQHYKKKDKILLYVFKDHQPKMWSTHVFVPITDQGFSNEPAFIQMNNRAFVVLKKEIGDVSILAYILVKSYIDNNNEYLSSKATRTFLQEKNLDIASYSDTVNIKNIYSKSGSYLFSVKLKDNIPENSYTVLQFACRIAALICFLCFLNSLCLYLSKKQYNWMAVLLLAAVFSLIRLADLRYNLFGQNMDYAIFDPKSYAYNDAFPNIWSVLLTAVLFLWFVFFVFTIRYELSINWIKKNKIRSYICAFLFTLSIYFIFIFIYTITGSLITNSTNIDFNFTKLMDLNFINWVYMGIISLGVLALNIYIDVIIFVLKRLGFTTNQLLNIHLLCVIIVILGTSFLLGKSSLINLFLSIIIIVKTLGNKYLKENILINYIAVLLLLAIVNTVIYSVYYRQKSVADMKVILNNLKSEDDANAVALLNDIENQIREDQQLIHLFMISLPYTNIDVVNDYIKQKYFSGYLSKYDFVASYYDQNNQPLGTQEISKPTDYREKVINNSIKISRYFYRTNSELGTREYFSNIPVQLDNNRLLNIVINLTNKDFSYNVPYPEILTDSRINNTQLNDKNYYSVALYKEGNLITQIGKYTYPNVDSSFRSKIGEYLDIADQGGYSHLSFTANRFTTYIISKKDPSIWEYIATTSFTFLVYFVIFMLYHFSKNVYRFIVNNRFTTKNMKYHLYKIVNTIQYSTRIQSSIISTVILAILISAIISYFSIHKQLYDNNQNSKEQFILDLAKRLENKLGTTDTQDDENGLIAILKTLSSTISKDFNLYSKNGRLLYSSQPRIYELELFSTFMNPKAVKDLSFLKKAETIEEERIGSFQFESSYATIRDNNYNTLGYIGIPNFTIQKDDNVNKNLLLNTIVNIYSLIIIGFGVYATLIADRVTNPLNVISKKISQLKLGQINEPLFWQRNDEIGTLIKEYNIMILKLEDYASKIKDTERESTWREMAQQIAHEIKNPLTPMKLGIQQLRRSYNDNDPRFPERFNKFSTSFIEQIEVLSYIASEFSHFAKFPNPILEDINILEKINKSIALFNNSPNTNIRLVNNTSYRAVIIQADKNEMLRTFNNLIKNAMESGYGRKKINIVINVSLYSEKFVKIDIKDNGFGIPERLKDRIFQFNFTTKSSGNGLGLVLVKKNIEAINGEITFDSTEGEGSVFHILIPIHRLIEFNA